MSAVMGRVVRRYRTLVVGGSFGVLLMGATYAMADIGSIKYSTEAKSSAYTEEEWNRLPMQKPKSIQDALQEFQKEAETQDDYSMLSSLPKQLEPKKPE